MTLAGPRVLRLRDFRLVFGASVISMLGDGMAPLALTFAVLELDASAATLGFVLGARTLGLVGSLLVGGVVADRTSRRRVMIVADLARLAAQGTVGALLIAGTATIGEIAAAQLVVGVATGFFNPASSGFLPAVAGPWLQQANSLRGMAMAAGGIAGPALGGVMVVATSPGVTLIGDALSFALSAALLARVSADPRRDRERDFVTDLRDGLREVRSRTWVWTTIAALSVVNLASVGVPVLGALVAKRDLGAATALALMYAIWAAGSFVGGLALLRFNPRRPLLFAVLVGIVPVVQPVVLALVAPLAVVAGCFFLAGAASTVFNALWETALQQSVPAEVRSRVSSYDWFGSYVFTAVGFALIGPLAEVVGVAEALYLCAGLELVAISSLLAVREVRRMTAKPA